MIQFNIVVSFVFDYPKAFVLSDVLFGAFYSDWSGIMEQIYPNKINTTNRAKKKSEYVNGYGCNDSNGNNDITNI